MKLPSSQLATQTLSSALTTIVVNEPMHIIDREFSINLVEDDEDDEERRRQELAGNYTDKLVLNALFKEQQQQQQLHLIESSLF